MRTSPFADAIGFAVVLLCATLCPYTSFAGEMNRADLDGGEHAAMDSSIDAATLEDAEIEGYRRDLLGLAMDAASMMPRDPHIKNRSRMQHEVFAACLDLDQPALARAFMKRIANWRRGAAAAEYALYCARYDRHDTAERYLKKAEAAAKLVDQDWRKQTIQLRVAEARLLLGDDAADDRVRRRTTEDMHRGKIEAFAIAHRETVDVEALSSRLDSLIASGRYEPILNAAEAYLRLYERLYEQSDRRLDIEGKLRQAYVGMGGAETLKLLMGFAHAALANGDAAEALRFIEEAETLAANAAWPEHQPYRYEFVSDLAELRALSDDSSGAVAKLDKLMERYDREGKKIVNIWRADALRSVAEAYAALGETDKAWSVYERAVAAGMVNPNGWPRATDLAKTCVSLALQRVEPSDSLLRSIHRAKAKLGAPW